LILAEKIFIPNLKLIQIIYVDASRERAASRMISHIKANFSCLIMLVRLIWIQRIWITRAH